MIAPGCVRPALDVERVVAARFVAGVDLLAEEGFRLRAQDSWSAA
jgi:hypothetical protein